jgi:putative YhdH/YhfP family quinone oxidoreductase
MSDTFRALVASKTEQDFKLEVKQLHLADLPEGEVLVKVLYSGLSYKDGLVCSPDGKVARRYPLVPGMELAGVVVASTSPAFKAGDEVMAGDYNEIGISRHGGYSEYARVPAHLLYPRPTGFSLKEAITLIGGGLTAMLALTQLEQNGLRPDKGPVLITGASGGVGSVAVSLFSQRGYRVVASTGKASESAYLKRLGASEILSREEVSRESPRPLETEVWAGSVDNVGGTTLAYLTRTIKKGGSIAAIGLTGGANFKATVYPFLLRGINLLGIDLPSCPFERRQELWHQLTTDFDLHQLAEQIQREITLEEVPAAVEAILQGKLRGRTLIKVGAENLYS